MADQEKPPVFKAPPPYQPVKYFLSSLNSFLANHLVARLRNDQIHPENPNRIVGTTIKNSTHQVPAGVRKVIDTEKVTFFEQVILNSDVIIYDLTTADLKEAQFIISTLKIQPFTDNKTLICISNVMTWARTSPKEKKQGDEQEGDQNPLEEPDSEQEGAPEPAEGEEKKTYVRFTDKDYNLRKPAPEYEKIKSIQTLCLAAGNVKPNLKSYVVCAGLQYGEGQNLFQDYFLQARLQIPAKLPVFGAGKNRIPTIHTADLVTYIEKIIEKTPKLPYILALDHNPKPTQKKIIESISKGIGTGQIECIEPNGNQKNVKQLTLNLRMKPTMIFAKIQEEDAAIEAQEGQQVVRFKFDWRSKDGIQKNVELLRQQYNAVHNLRQEKIFIMGPPGSGKTYFSKQLYQKYYLPHITIKTVIDEVMSLKNEFGQEIKNFLNQKKENEIQNKQAQYEEFKQKWKKIPKDQRDPLPPFDPQAVDVRLSDQLVYKCFKWRLTQNDCLNRGYILDGFPRRYQDAKELFMSPPPVPEGEQPDENAKKILDERLAPTKLIMLEMTDKQIIERIQKLPEQQISRTHLTQAKIKHLLARYRAQNNSDSGEYVIEDFFKENKIPSHHVKIGPQTAATLESLIKETTIDEVSERSIIQQRLKGEKDRKANLRAEMDKKEKIIREIQKEDYDMKKKNEQNEERDILDKTSLALRKYLDANLVPILSEGIVELLNSFPNDPVDNLAEFLFKNSLKVPNPDPTTFDF